MEKRFTKSRVAFGQACGNSLGASADESIFLQPHVATVNPAKPGTPSSSPALLCSVNCSQRRAMRSLFQIL